MRCPNCGFNQVKQSQKCSSCGIVFSRFRAKPSAREPEGGAQQGYEYIEEVDRGVVYSLLFYVKPRINPLDFGCRVLVAVIFFVWGLKYIFSSINGFYESSRFWHLVNLPFHEAGHYIFMFFGQLIKSLGGTLGQLLMPIICMVTLLVKTRDAFGAAFCLWWLGVSFMDIAPYIDDARRLTMPLLGGNTGKTSPYGFHDWEYILTETGLLRFDHTLAWLSYKTGSLMMILAFAWWAYVLYKQSKNIDTKYMGD